MSRYYHDPYKRLERQEKESYKQFKEANGLVGGVVAFLLLPLFFGWKFLVWSLKIMIWPFKLIFKGRK